MDSTIIKYREMDSPIGPLVILLTEKGICNIQFGTYDFVKDYLYNWAKKWLNTNEIMEDKDVHTDAENQLNEYFTGKRQYFDMPLVVYGTSFQQKVWKALQNISYGETKSYKQIAIEIGNEKAVRAIGGANNKNPIPIIIPCHRVIGADGSMVGYGGGLNKKTILLDLEQM